jgi:hypothetical protein
VGRLGRETDDKQQEPLGPRELPVDVASTVGLGITAWKQSLAVLADGVIDIDFAKL